MQILIISEPSFRYDENDYRTDQLPAGRFFCAALSSHCGYRQAFSLIYLTGDDMRRRRIRGRSRENGFFLLTVICLLVLLTAGFKEQLFCLVYPGISYISGASGEDKKLYQYVAAFSNGYYGYVLEYQKPDTAVENTAGVKSLLTESELEQEELPEDERYHEGMAEDESVEELFLSEGIQEEIAAENERMQTTSGEFQKAETRAQVLDYEKLLNFEYLKKNFYTVDSSTNIGEDRLNARRMLEYDATISTDSSKPQILIYHTHAHETFADSVEGDTSTTIVGVGEKLAQILREEYGFNVIHDTGVYDTNRDYAYSVAGPVISQILEENPSIEVVIDLHRDGVADTTHLVTDVGGRPTAQFMFFNGLSYLNGKGDIDYLENPYIEENLAFSFQMKLAADEYYPGFARNIYLKGLRYNMHFREKSLLIEVGAQTNTVEEVMNATEPIAHILAMVLKGEKP